VTQLRLMGSIVVIFGIRFTDSKVTKSALFLFYNSITKPMKEKAPMKHSLHEKTAAPALPKLFISSNE